MYEDVQVLEMLDRAGLSLGMLHGVKRQLFSSMR